MKIKHITIDRNDISKENVKSGEYSYNSVVNNNTSDTSESVIELTAAVLLDIHQSIQEDADNEGEETA